MQLMVKSVETEIQKPQQKNPSRVQAHLANERTYLAWMRTAISLMGFGVVIVRLRTFHPPILPQPGNGWKLGLLFSLVGLVTVLLSTHHYFSVCQHIEQDTYQPTDRWVILFSLAVTLLGAGVIYYVFTAPLSPMSFMVPE
ncbi:MAG: DUF202 domain-containing protein [Microcoleus vaginatus WJT46-NPBG5]|jgi:putative membrane protein|nr:DUF202 domain-containing protein [Microcoleus vaginatus WJT46-NPBG5]